MANSCGVALSVLSMVTRVLHAQRSPMAALDRSGQQATSLPLAHSVTSEHGK